MPARSQAPHAVGVAINGRDLALLQVIDVLGRRETIDLDVPAFDLSEFMRVHVVDDAGQLVRDAKFSIRLHGRRGSAAGPCAYYRLLDGSYRVGRRLRMPSRPHGLGLDPLRGSESAHSLRVRSATCEETTVEYDPDALELSIVLTRRSQGGDAHK